MPNPTLRISLPGFDAGTDTNLDHFALNTDQDNVLIKEFSRGGGTVVNGGTVKIIHNLGYIPFYLMYINFNGTSNVGWSIVPAYTSNGFSQPAYAASVDTGTLTLTNYGGSATPYKYYIFYDNFTGNAGTFAQSKQAIKIAKQGIDAGTATDANSFIFHSDLNTFKILKEGTTALSYTGTSASYFSIAHNAGSVTSFAAFIKFPDGKTAFLPGYGDVYSYDSNWQAYFTNTDGTNINLTILGTGNATLPFKYYVFETPLI